MTEQPKVHDHLSYSQISTYLDCSERWRAGYIDGKKGAPTDSLVFGTTAHLVIEQIVAGKVQLDPAAMAEAWCEAWSRKMAEPESARIDWGDSSPSDCEATGIRVFSSDETVGVLAGVKPRIAQDGTPMIERKVEWKLDGLPPIVGYIDCLAEDGVPVDFKTAGKMWADSKALKEIQPLFYLSALEQAGEHDHLLRFRHIVLTKAKNPRAVLFETQRRPEELAFMERVVRGVWSGISSGHFVPNPTSMWCSISCAVYTSCAGAMCSS